MQQEILGRVSAAMKTAGLDAIVTSSPENFAYLNGYVVPSQPLIRHRHAFTVLTADGSASLLVVDMEKTTVATRSPGADMRVWAEFEGDAMGQLATLLSERGLASAAIGIEMDQLPAGDLAALVRLLPGARFVAAEALLARVRQIKTTAEIALLRRLSRIADQAIGDALNAVALGSTEMDIAAALTRGVYALGAESFKLMIVATGERSQLPNVGPSERALQRGDVCRVEIFSVISGYQAGVCRTAVVQQAPPHAERIWQHLVECKYLMMELIRPGASAREVYRRFIDKLRLLDLPPISFVGHGIGLHLHEEPYLGTHPVIGSEADVPLEAGMVLGIEPLCYRTGHGFGMQNKDMFLVTADGCELLSDVTDTDRLIVVR
jgi:Xaa-Pro aminopeptidase